MQVLFSRVKFRGWSRPRNYFNSEFFSTIIRSFIVTSNGKTAVLKDLGALLLANKVPAGPAEAKLDWSGLPTLVPEFANACVST